MPEGLDAADLALVDQHASVVASCRNALVEDVQRELFSLGDVWLSSPEVQAAVQGRLGEVMDLLAAGRCGPDIVASCFPLDAAWGVHEGWLVDALTTSQGRLFEGLLATEDGGPMACVRAMGALRKVAFLDVGILWLMQGAGVRHAVAGHRALDPRVRRDHRFRKVVEFATDTIIMTDSQGRITYFNQAAEKMFGMRRQDVRGQPFSILVFDHIGTIDGLGDRALTDAGLGTSVRLLRGLRRDGTVFPIECTGHAFQMEGERIGAWVLRDVSERTRAEEALRRSEANFRSLIEASPDAISVQRDGRFVYVNPRTVESLGYEDREELVGRLATEVVHPERRDAVGRSLREMLRDGLPLNIEDGRFVRKDGTTMHAEVRALPLLFDGVPSIVVIARDVSELKQMQATLVQADRMASVGTLAAGVAHEINNPLTYVLYNLEHMAEEVAPLLAGVEGAGGSAGIGLVVETLRALTERMDEAQDGARRVRAIVQDLKTFARVEEETRVPVALNETIDRATNMAWNQIKYRARLVKDYGDVPAVCASEGRLAQVFLNLLVNAAQALDDVGDDRTHEIRVRTWAEGDHVLTEVSDTGRGIPPHHLEQVFDPFFSTKPKGEGSGLGLPICKNIVQAFGGEISVSSRPGKGTSFRVSLPVATEAEVIASTQQPDDGLSPEVATPRGRILIVDDEHLVGNSLKRMLRRDHDVQVLDSGAEALALLEVDPEFDVVLCDIMMDEVTGMDLHIALSRSQPELARRIVFITGGAFTPRARRFLREVPNLHLEKPLDIAHLRRLLRTLLLVGGRGSVPQVESP
jgi:PAS domain S-box-containing protein